MPALATDPLRAIEMTLGRARAAMPALVPLLDAFGPLIAERARIRQDAPGWNGPAPAVDPERYAQGAPILADGGFEDMSAQIEAAARRLLPLMAESFPALADEFQALAAALQSGILSPAALAGVAFGGSAEALGVSEATLRFAAAELTRPFLERQAEDLMALVKDLPWRQTCCPVCGSAPNMSVLRPESEDTEFIKAHGGRRFLRCSCCATQWTHKRVSCPACGCEEPNDLVVLRDPARPFERADACTRCKSFVLCLDVAELAEIPDPDVAALTMLPLEMRARKEGYTPLGLHPWSNF